ncbi:MAG: ATP--guanido phosphotransferase [Chitinispirillia bacterium]|nr:ATP--guanido phosphotransferase [Chitinispirillia bacterium]MCL2267902.1 ATP--guanido phosphotransferase [Chitinispirillia bacterium]
MSGATGSKTASARLRLSGGMPVWLDNLGPDEDVVVSTRIRLARNLAAHKFPSRASARDKQKIFKEASAVLGSSSMPCGKFEIINFGRLRRLEQHYLAEERLVSVDMLKGEGERGVACDGSRKYCVMINEEDHLRIQGMASGFHTFDLWEMTSKVDDCIGKGLKYAYSERFGFLTACPTNSGTGLRVSYLMHLPGLVLTKAIDATLQGASQMGISTRGFFGEHSDVVGNLFQLSNRATMGASEAEFIETTSKVIREIICHERTARERLLKDAGLEVADKVWRAHGMLCNARVLGFPELLNLTSALRLGIDCGFYDVRTIDDINRLIMLCMPAHLQVCISDMARPSEDLDVARAGMVRDAFAGAKKRARRKASS